MTTSLALSSAQQNAIVAWNMTREQLDLLKRTVAQGTSDDEFALFMTTATRLGLDPFAKQIYAVKRSTWDRDLNRNVDKMAIQVGIDGFRSVADRTGENDGQEGPFWCGDDGVWKDAWLKDEPPAAAMVRVFRKGCSKPFTGIATYRSYVQTNREGKANRQWSQMPDVMVAKCAEALALRKAFPTQLSGVYTPEEMGQASNDNGPPPTSNGDARELPAGEPPVFASIEMASTEAELQSLVSIITKLPAADKKRARELWGAQRALIRQEAASAEATR